MHDALESFTNLKWPEFTSINWSSSKNKTKISEQCKELLRGEMNVSFHTTNETILEGIRNKENLNHNVSVIK